MALNQPTQPAVNLLNPAWAHWFSAINDAINALRSSGTTAQRPTRGLYPGRPYFDTSLAANGRPIWVNKAGTGWVHSDGSAA